MHGTGWGQVSSRRLCTISVLWVTLALVASSISGCDTDRPSLSEARRRIVVSGVWPADCSIIDQWVRAVSDMPTPHEIDVKFVECITTATKTMPDVVCEEAIIVVNWSRVASAGQWGLAYIVCLPGRQSWKVTGGLYGLPGAFRPFQDCPTPMEIGEFIKESNYGYNECEPAMHVNRVALYRNDPTIRSALLSRVPESELQRRLSQVPRL